MKKRILILVSALLLTGCGSEKESNTSSETSSSVSESSNVAVTYDEPYYSDFAALSNAASLIFEGNVIGRHTEYIDDTTGEIVTESDNAFLYTVYDVSVTETYKGKISDTIMVKVSGDNKTVKTKYFADLENEKEYLFFADQFGDSPAFLVSSSQGVYCLNDENLYEPVVDSSLEAILFKKEDLQKVTS